MQKATFYLLRRYKPALLTAAQFFAVLKQLFSMHLQTWLRTHLTYTHLYFTSIGISISCFVVTSSLYVGYIMDTNQKIAACRQRCCITGPRCSALPLLDNTHAQWQSDQNKLVSSPKLKSQTITKINNFLLVWSQRDKVENAKSTARGKLTGNRHSPARGAAAQVKAVSLTEEHIGKSCFSSAAPV